MKKKKKVQTKADLEKELRKAKRGTRYWKKKYNREYEKRMTEEDFVEECKDILSASEPLRPLKRVVATGEHRLHDSANLLSDMQIGEKIQKKETGYQDFNPGVLKKQVERLYEGLMTIVDIHRRSYEIKKHNILSLGDLVEGTGNIYRGQGSRITTDVVEQALDFGVPLISNFIRSVAQNFDEVYVPCVVGNHGRLRRKDEDLLYANWDYVLMKFVKEVLSHVKNVTVDANKCWWRIIDIQGWKFYMEHGDAIQKYMRLPWYGIARADGDTTMMLQAMKKVYQYYCIGHFHEYFIWDRPHGQRICNGTFATGNVFAMHKLKVTVRPTQMFFLVHPKTGAVGHYPIRMDLKEKRIK